MKTKICMSTKAIPGCGEYKDINLFPKTKHGHQAVCKECVAKARKAQHRGTALTEEARIFETANRLMNASLACSK